MTKVGLVAKTAPEGKRDGLVATVPAWPATGDPTTVERTGQAHRQSPGSSTTSSPNRLRPCRGGFPTS
jgi:hypothetical protein